jgi:glucokinase
MPSDQAGERALTGTIGTTWLVGDVSATNARFGLVSPAGAVLHSSNFACADFADIAAAIDLIWRCAAPSRCRASGRWRSPRR